MGINNLVGRDMELKNHNPEEKDAPRTDGRGGIFFWLLALVSIFCTPFAAQAATLSSGGDTSANVHFQHSGANGTDRPMQPVGTGFSNTGGTINLYMKGDAAATGAQMQVVLVEWASQSDFTSDGGQNAGAILSNTNMHWGSSGGPTTHANDHTGSDYVDTWYYTQTLNPSHFYSVFVGGDAGTDYGGTIYGSASPASGLTRTLNALCSFTSDCPKNYSTLQSLYFQFTDSGGATPANTNTRIDTTVPVGNSTVASSTSFAFGATGYLNPADDDGNEFLRISASYDTPGEKNLQEQLLIPATCLVGIPALWCLVGLNGQQGATGDFPITQGSISISTTTTLIDSGRYTMTTSIMKPYFSLFGFNFGTYTLTSTTTQFVIGQLTASDKAYDYILQQNANFASTTVNLLSNCAIATFNLADCVTGFFIPNPAQLGGIWGQLRDGFLSAYPWGYVTRLAVIVSGTATSSLPNLAVSTPTTVNGKAFPIYATLNDNVWSTLPGSGGSLLDTATSSDNKTFRQVVEPVYNSLVLVMFAIALIPLVSGINIRGSDWSGFESESTTTGTNAKGQQYGSSQHTIGRRRKRDL